jgi:hypothetical protein
MLWAIVKYIAYCGFSCYRVQTNLQTARGFYAAFLHILCKWTPRIYDIFLKFSQFGRIRPGVPNRVTRSSYWFNFNIFNILPFWLCVLFLLFFFFLYYTVYMAIRLYRANIMVGILYDTNFNGGTYIKFLKYGIALNKIQNAARVYRSAVTVWALVFYKIKFIAILWPYNFSVQNIYNY